MKTVITFLFLFFFLTGFTQQIYAQDKLDKLMEETTPEERASLQTRHMTETLSLTEDQQAKVSTINLTYARKTQDAYTSGGGKMQKFQKLKKIGGEKDVALKGVFTPAQYMTYDKNKEAMKEKLKAKAKEKKAQS